MLPVGGETYRKRFWSNVMFPLVPQDTRKGQEHFSVKLFETNSPKQDFPNNLNKSHKTTKEKVVLVATFLKANCAILSQS